MAGENVKLNLRSWLWGIFGFAAGAAITSAFASSNTPDTSAWELFLGVLFWGLVIAVVVFTASIVVQVLWAKFTQRIKQKGKSE